MMVYSDELYHYGVLGMKWGMHRARRKGQDYVYNSMRTNRDIRKLAKIKNKLEKATAKGNSGKIEKYKNLTDSYKKDLEGSKALDRARVDYARRTSVGKAIVQNLLVPGNTRNYQSARAVGIGRARALGGAWRAAAGGIAERLVNSAYRGSYGERALANEREQERKNKHKKG